MISAGCCPERPAAASLAGLVEGVGQTGVEGVEGGVGRVRARPGGQGDGLVPLAAVVQRPDLVVHRHVARPTPRSAPRCPAGPGRRPPGPAELFQAVSKAAPEPRAIRVRLSLDLALLASIRALAAALTAAKLPVWMLPTVRVQVEQQGHSAGQQDQQQHRAGEHAEVEGAAEPAGQPDLADDQGGQDQRREDHEDQSDPDLHPVLGAVGVGRDQVVGDGQGVRAELGAGRPQVLRPDRQALPVVGPGLLDRAGVVDDLLVQQRPGRRRRPAGPGPPGRSAWPASVRAWSYCARCAGGSSPPTRNALVAVASAISRLVWICCTRISWSVSASARASEYARAENTRAPTTPVRTRRPPRRPG